jgi:hypothetical protein
MEDKDGPACPADDTKSSIDPTRAQVIAALYHLERAFLRMRELKTTADLRSPEQEIVARIVAAIYEIQAISFNKPANHDQIIAEASIFDDLKPGGFLMRS